MITVERRKGDLDRRIVNLGHRRRRPFRRMILVDDHGTHALIEIRARQAPAGHAQILPHHIFEAEISPLAQAGQGQLQRRRRLAGDDLGLPSL